MSDYKSGTTIPHSKIFDYWKDKCIDKFGNVYPNIPEYYDKTIEVVTDWGEPECWCCRKVIPVEKEEKYDEWISDNSDKGLKRIWDSKTSKHYLNRAHIKPKMLGGEDKPENLFLICEQCHKNSPDISDYRMFLSYIYDYRTNKDSGWLIPINIIKEATDILRNVHGIKIPIFDNLDTLTKCGQHGGSISESTKIYQFVSVALKNRTQLRDDLEDMFKKYIKEKIEEIKTSICTTFDDKEKDKLQSNLLIYENIINVYETFKSLENV